MVEEISCKCRHFVTYTGVKLPLKLLNELDDTQLGNRNTFFRGYFDAEERLLRLEKIVYNEIEMEHRYTYDNDGQLTHAEIIDGEGEVTVMDFTGSVEAAS
ncbi:MAG: DUF6156 family protein [Methylococcaceae bacterium]|jgi:hypothetical protein